MRIAGIPLKAVVLIAVIGAGVLLAGQAIADEFEQLELKVNIVKGSGTTKEQAEAKQKEINDILDQCDKKDRRMRVTISEVETDVDEIGTISPVPAENVTDSQQADVLKEAEKEVPNGGVKIVVFKSFASSNTFGSTREGGIVERAVSVNDSAGGDTWAHELGHAMGLGHKTDESNKDNLMFAPKNKRTGTKLTSAQCDIIKDFGFKRLGAEKRCSEDQEESDECEPGDDSTVDSVFDETGDVGDSFLDLASTFFSNLHEPGGTLLVQTRVGSFPGTPVSATYEIGFDTDGDMGTGGLVGPHGGFDLVARITANGIFPFGGGSSATLVSLPGNVALSPLTFGFSRALDIVEVEVGPLPDPIVIGGEIHVEVPVALMGPLPNPMRVVVAATSSPSQDTAGPQFIVTLRAAGPEIVLTPRTVLPGDVMTVDGSGFSPSVDVRIVVADDEAAQATTDTLGAFSKDIVIPSLAPDHYLLDAIDDDGNFGLEVLTIDDGDGVPIADDACPFVAGLADRQGCPVGDENLVELHVVDQANTGVCPGGDRSCRLPAADAEIRVYDRNQLIGLSVNTLEDSACTGSAATLTKNPDGFLYDDIFECEPSTVCDSSAGACEATCTTDPLGSCTAGEETVGDYLVIAKWEDIDSGKTVYTGKPKGPDDFADTNSDGKGDLATKEFQILKVIRRDGSVQLGSGSKTVVTGSFLEVVYPDYAVWEDAVSGYVYPFIFTSDSSWEVDICARVPEGYEIVGVHDEAGALIGESGCSHSFVSGETLVVAFEVAEVGSPEPLLTSELRLTHEGKVSHLRIDVPGLRTYVSEAPAGLPTTGGPADAGGISALWMAFVAVGGVLLASAVYGARRWL